MKTLKPSQAAELRSINNEIQQIINTLTTDPTFTIALARVVLREMIRANNTKETI
jgi:hypothetical protein